MASEVSGRAVRWRALSGRRGLSARGCWVGAGQHYVKTHTPWPGGSADWASPGALEGHGSIPGRGLCRRQLIGVSPKDGSVGEFGLFSEVFWLPIISFSISLNPNREVW